LPGGGFLTGRDVGLQQYAVPLVVGVKQGGRKAVAASVSLTSFAVKFQPHPGTTQLRGSGRASRTGRASYFNSEPGVIWYSGIRLWN